MENQDEKCLLKVHMGRSQIFRREILAGLGRAIMEERQRQNLRLVVLAQQIGVRAEKLECLELGRAPINWECLRRVVQALGKRVELRLIDQE